MNKFIVCSSQQVLGRGDLIEAARIAKSAQAEEPTALPIIYNWETGRALDVDLSGSEADIADWIALHHPDEVQQSSDTPTASKRGRPKLGVVAKEVTLLPRHWEWLATQSGGASATLRRLVEQASRDPASERRAHQDATYRLAQGIAGDAPGFEEAIRALYNEDEGSFYRYSEAWPDDIRDVCRERAQHAWS